MPNRKVHKTRRRDQKNIWQYQLTVSRRLLIWAGFNVIFGTWLQQQRNKFWRGVAMQAIGWGTINACIALIGTIITNHRQQRSDAPFAKRTIQNERHSLLRLLWINTVLDIIYMLGGLTLAMTKGRRHRLLRGNGWGIVMQGGFLFFFDLIHTLIIHDSEMNGKPEK